MLSNSLFTAFLPFILISTINGSHFLGGTITWRIQNVSANAASVAILITQTYSWTYVTGRCDGTSIANSQPVSGTSGSLTCSPSCPTGFGTVSATTICTDVSPLNGIAVGQRSDTVVIPAGSNFSVVFTGGAWNSLISGGSSWTVLSYINLVQRVDNGLFNNAPVATIMSPINIQPAQTTLITIPVSDADGDPMRCRWANASNGASECYSVCPPSSLPPNTIIYPNCTMQITGTTAGQLYAVTVMVEDFINSSSTIPLSSVLSSVPVQFIVKIVASPLCSTPSETIFIGQSCTPLQVNQTFTSQLLAINNCGVNVSIIDIATLSFSGMIQSSIMKLNSQTYYKNISWTPTDDQLGYHVMCAMALDSQYARSPQYCFTFYVTENGTGACPGVTNNSTVATTTTATASPTTTSAKITTSTGINWPLIGILSALAFLFAITFISCLLYRYYRIYISKRQRQSKFYNENSPSLRSTTLSSDSVYTVEDETVDRSTVCQTLSNNDKCKVDNDAKQKSPSNVFSAKNNIVPLIPDGFDSFMQPYHASPKIRNEKVTVKNVPLPVAQMITETRPSQIETIDLLPTNAKSANLPQIVTDIMQSTNIAHTEQINIMGNKVKTVNVLDAFEPQLEKSPKSKKRHKKSLKIHVSVKHRSKQN